jgi:hypothetical protein
MTGDPVASSSIAEVRTGIPYHVGTTAPTLGLKFAEHASRLVVPVDFARPPAPLDFIGVYVTWDEVIDGDLDLRLIIETLGIRDILTTLATLAALLRRVEEEPRSVERDRELAALFQAPYRGRAETLINAGHVLITAQGILGLIKLVIAHCSGNPSPDAEDSKWVVLGVLATQGMYGTERGGDSAEMEGLRGDPATAVSVVRSQLFSMNSDLVTTLAHGQLRWRDIPERLSGEGGHVDLEKTFEDTTGVPLDDFVAVGLAIWIKTRQEDASVLLDDGLGLSLPKPRIDAAVRLLSATPTQLRRELKRTRGLDALEWSFDALRRFPVVRFRGRRLVVLSPRLVMERVFSLVRWDVEYALRTAGRTAAANRVRQFWQHVCEVEARESLAAMAPESGFAKRLYSEDDLARAYATKRRRPKLSDFALDYPNAWIVGDVTSSTLNRDIQVGAGQSVLEAGLAKIVAKAWQIQSTIDLLREAESKLTGAPPRPGRRFIPLLVMAEGFPVNPVTVTVLQARLEKAGALQANDVGPLHLIDNEELSILEALSAEGHSLLDLLLGHETSNLERMALRDYLLVERRLSPRRPERLEDSFKRAWEPILRLVKT